MILIRGLRSVRAPHRGSAVTIGVFDGVHRGHQAVLAQLCQQARLLAVEPTVVTFEPLPREYFDVDAAPPRLQSLRDKVAALSAYGVTRVLCLRFDASLADLDARAFVEKVLVSGLAARSVVIGDDFRFGRDRGGDFALLKLLGREHGFGTTAAPTASDGERISSTRIRAALAAGRPEEAAELIGRPYSVSGRVRRGDALGRRLGFPTANLVPSHDLALAHGVYAVDVRRADGKRHRGAAHWGTRGRLEVHLLDFDADLYGERLVIGIRRFIRPDAKFDTLDALQAQIARDVQEING
ncbi:MAG: bifunctional riboflavin kinase/FAD synthetase [Gammaproteobacteria bacterium]